MGVESYNSIPDAHQPTSQQIVPIEELGASSQNEIARYQEYEDLLRSDRRLASFSPLESAQFNLEALDYWVRPNSATGEFLLRKGKKEFYIPPNFTQYIPSGDTPGQLMFLGSLGLHLHIIYGNFSNLDQFTEEKISAEMLRQLWDEDDASLVLAMGKINRPEILQKLSKQVKTWSKIRQKRWIPLIGYI